MYRPIRSPSEEKEEGLMKPVPQFSRAGRTRSFELPSYQGRAVFPIFAYDGYAKIRNRGYLPFRVTTSKPLRKAPNRIFAYASHWKIGNSLFRPSTAEFSRPLCTRKLEFRFSRKWTQF